MTNSLDPHARRAYRRRAAPYLLPAWLLLLAGLGALFGTGDMPTSVSQIITVDWVERLWQIGYTAAAACLIVGLMRPLPLVELVGDWLALWALAVNLACLLAARGVLNTGLVGFTYGLTITVIGLRINDLLTRPHEPRSTRMVTRAEKRFGERDDPPRR